MGVVAELDEQLRDGRTTLGQAIDLSRKWTWTWLILLMSDLAALFLGSAAAVVVRWVGGGQFSLQQYVQLWPLIMVFPLVFSAQGLYRGHARAPAEELRFIIRCLTLVFLSAGAFIFLLGQGIGWSRGVYLLAWAFSLVLVPLNRVIFRSFLTSRAWYGQPTLILGAGRTGELVIRQLQDHPATGLRPVAVLDDDASKWGRSLGVPVVGGLDLAPRLAREFGIRHAVVAMPGADHQRLIEIEREEEDIFPHLVIIPPLVGFAGMWVEARGIGAILGLEVKRRLLLPWPRFLKRSLDLISVLVGGILIALPLTLLIALAIRLDSPGPVFYGQRRIGRGGREFKAWKFRSMVVDADAALERHLSANPELREEWERDHKLKNDPRITWVGRILRKTSLDELPQLWNVLKGEMSLVGPRPIVRAEVSKYGQQYSLYQRVRPGMSGLWQVSGRSETSYDERVALDVYYVRNWSVWLDIYILASTIRVVLLGRGAC